MRPGEDEFNVVCNKDDCAVSNEGSAKETLIEETGSVAVL
jgi:hypothetical protein